MSLRSIAYIALAVFLLLYGLMSVTNFNVNHMAEICGFSALVAGVLMFIVGVKQGPPG